MTDSRVLLGYPDRLSVAPGEAIRFMVTCEGAAEYDAALVRLIHGDPNPRGPGFKEEVVVPSIGERHPGRRQRTVVGSYASVDDGGTLTGSSGFTLHAFVCPTRLTSRSQAIVAKWDGERDDGYLLALDPDGRLRLRIGHHDGSDGVVLPEPLQTGCWYEIAATYDHQDKRAAIRAEPAVGRANSRPGLAGAPAAGCAAERIVPAMVDAARAPFLIAGAPDRDGAIAGRYNGKIEEPAFWDRALGDDELDRLLSGAAASPPLAKWNFAPQPGARTLAGIRIPAVGADELAATLVNMPMRGVTGHRWTGEWEHFSHAPGHYGAIHFHDDDLEDCGWAVDFELCVPEDLPSGIYAARLRAGALEDHVPFAVRPARGSTAAPMAFLLPTASYIAYANEHLISEDGTADPGAGGRSPTLTPGDLLLHTRPDLGLSHYDLHSDGSGVCYGSRLRPILGMRPRHRCEVEPWQLPADLYLIDWLTSQGHAFDVVTDEDLHQEGYELLAPYRAVMTGTHPEYCTGEMLDALELYTSRGGRLMYMGGNGFYWVASFHPERPHVMEVRRGETGSREWQVAPGEYVHATTGERGGLWRHRGRAPQKLVGVGFTAMGGFDAGSHYRRLPDSFRPETAFIFEGVEDDERIGDFGLAGGGAAGQEIDRSDRALGTPPGAFVLASSEAHSDTVLRAVEEIGFMTRAAGGLEDPAVRADLVYFTRPGGGAVFSTGSIAWSASLSHNGYENNVSRITGNVVRQFLDDGDRGSGSAMCYR